VIRSPTSSAPSVANVERHTASTASNQRGRRAEARCDSTGIARSIAIGVAEETASLCAMRNRLLIAAALVALVFAVFAQVRTHDFVDYDDALYLEKAQHGVSRAGFRAAFSEEVAANWIPVTVLTLLVEYELHGREAPGFLLGNVALHAAATVVLFLALLRMTGAPAPSAFSAAVFGIHPLHVESVAWLSQRKDVLCGLCWMTALLAHARYAERPSLGRRACVVALGALALGAKPMAVTLPFTLMLLDYWPLGRLRGTGGALPDPRRLVASAREQLPLFALAAIVAGLTYGIQDASAAIASDAVLPLAERVANAVLATAAYLGDAFWPSGLAAFYPHPIAALATGRVLAAAALLLGLTAVLVATAARHPYGIVGWLWFLGTLVPVIGLVQVGMQARADRYTYVPLVGLAVAVGFGAAAVARRLPALRLPIAAAGVAVIAALASVAHAQVAYWRDSQALFERALAVTERNFFAERGLARALAASGREDEALEHFGAAIRLRPGWSKPRLELAALLLERGNTSAAIVHYRRGLELEPGDLRARVNLGRALLAEGRLDAARAQLTRVETAVAGGAPLSRRFRGPLEQGLGALAAADGQPAAAVRHYRAALRHTPALAAASHELAWLLATHPDPSIREPAEALRLAESLVRRDEGNPVYLDTLAAAYASLGRFGAAIDHAERAVRLAVSGRDPALAAEIRARLALYRRGQPYRT
jgi:tetratricopeptide (TPR) repeat protein